MRLSQALSTRGRQESVDASEKSIRSRNRFAFCRNGPSDRVCTSTRQTQILSAFHCADDRRAVRAMKSCNLPLNKTVDGMPLVFSVEIEQSTLEPSDVRVALSDGRSITPICATTGPASEEN